MTTSNKKVQKRLASISKQYGTVRTIQISIDKYKGKKRVSYDIVLEQHEGKSHKAIRLDVRGNRCKVMHSYYTT